MTARLDTTLPTPAPWFRRLLPLVARLVLTLFARFEVRGVENVPRQGRALIASNHLGHLDAFVSAAALPRACEVIVLSDLFDVPVTGQVLRWYGAIPVERDVFDRDALRLALDVLGRDELLWVAPEAQISETGAMMQGREGVAWLAARSGARVVPVAITGTERAFDDLRRLRRPRLTITFGEPLSLPVPPHAGRAARSAALAANTETLMRAIAALLPPRYRGVYG